ncbi:MAG: hypothetical protein ACTSQI_14785 [Candidatus Helarchaeota archaeon]
MENDGKMVMAVQVVEEEEDKVAIKTKKKYLTLFHEICDEDELDPREELRTTFTKRIHLFLNSFQGRTGANLEYKKCFKHLETTKRIPGFNIHQVEKILRTMSSFKEKIECLEQFNNQLKQTWQILQSNQINIPQLYFQDNSRSLTPYILSYPLAIRTIEKKIRQLKAEHHIHKNTNSS